jgi:polyferredoxin
MIGAIAALIRRTVSLILLAIVSILVTFVVLELGFRHLKPEHTCRVVCPGDPVGAQSGTSESDRS